MSFEQIADMGMGLLLITGVNAFIGGCIFSIYVVIDTKLWKKRELKKEETRNYL